MKIRARKYGIVLVLFLAHIFAWVLFLLPWQQVQSEPAGRDPQGNELVRGTVTPRRWHPGYWLSRFVQCKPVNTYRAANGEMITVWSFSYPHWNPLGWFVAA